MPVIINTATTSKTYCEWKEVFDSVDDSRTVAGIEVLCVGHALENDHERHVVQRVISIDAFTARMDNNREVIASSSVDPSSVALTVCTDWTLGFQGPIR